ncbi:hypothetical protein [Aliarcobacter butzleri]|uniref:hypothetical protein n=1 Tax=Aliarcobacter butzleri TaxID=28197 RepID=UPI00126A3D78|nr:hypothetical protein [Aliarcobacter butzleri]
MNNSYSASTNVGWDSFAIYDRIDSKCLFNPDNIWRNIGQTYTYELQTCTSGGGCTGSGMYTTVKCILKNYICSNGGTNLNNGTCQKIDTEYKAFSSF